MNFGGSVLLRVIAVGIFIFGGVFAVYSFAHLGQKSPAKTGQTAVQKNSESGSSQPFITSTPKSNQIILDEPENVLAATSSSQNSFFSQLVSGINSTAKMVVGGKASLTYAGGVAEVGGINASALAGKTWANPGEIGIDVASTARFSDTVINQNFTLKSLKDGFLRVNGVGETTASRISLSSSADVADRLPTASGGTGNDFSATGIGSVLTFSAQGQMTSLSPGTSGYVLMSNGTGSVPSWQSVSAGSVDWANPGTIGSTTPNTAIFSTLKVATGTPFQIDANGRVTLAYSGDAGYLNSSGGAIFMDNTNNIGTAIGIYSNAGASALGNMINVKVDNALYDQAAFYMNYDGTSNAVEIVSNSSDTSSNALAVTGNNINDSTVGIIGYELGRGTIKVSHYRPTGGTDSNASGISIDLKGSGTRAQGLYVDSTETGGTLGNLMRLRNESIDKFVVNYQGNLTMTGNISQGAYGSDTTFTKFGNTTGDQFFVGTTGAFRVARSASNSEAFRVQVNGDTQGRWLGTSDGRLKWGDGSTTQDVVLRRGAAGLLYLEGSININNLNADADTVIKGVNDSNLFYVDASTDNIGIGTSAPQSPLHISKNSGGAPAVQINQTGAADLLTLTATNSAKFAVTNAGNIDSVAGAGWRPLTDAVIGLQIQKANGTGFVTFDTSNNRVGIGTTSPGAPLQVSGGDIWMDNNQALRMKDSGGSARSILAYSSGNNVQLYNYAATGVLQIGINNVSNTGGNIRFFTDNNTEKMRIDPAGVGIGATTFGNSSSNVLAIANSVAPTTSITDGIQLFAVDVAGNHELRVRDEAGNITTLSPHNFSAIPEGASDPMAWAFYSERGTTAINVDMMKTVRLVESLSGQQLVHIKDLNTGENKDQPIVGLSQSLSDQDWLKRTDLNSFLSWTNELVTFSKEVVFAARAKFDHGLAIWGKAELHGPVQVTGNTSGQVTIPAGAEGIKVTFATIYEKTPVVYVTPLTSTENHFGVSNISTSSFEIHLTKAAEKDIDLQWLAMLTDNENKAQTEVIGGNLQPQPSEVPVQTQNPSPVPTPSPTVVLGASDSAQVQSASESAIPRE